MPNIGQITPPFPSPPPATLGAGLHWDSGIMPSGGYTGFLYTAQLDQAGTMQITRYADPAGTLSLGTAPAQALTANVLGWTYVNDRVPYSAIQIRVTNQSGSTAALSNTFALGSIGA